MSPSPQSTDIVVTFPAQMDTFTARTVYIKLLDISLADAPAKLLQEKTCNDVICETNGSLNLSIDKPSISAQQQVTLQLHFSRAGVPQLKTGDLISPQIYPIKPETQEVHVVLTLI